MSTRCHIGFYEPGEKDFTKHIALIYRHSDGYPGTVDGKEYGVLPDILPFLNWFNKNRGCSDVEYCAARLLQYLCDECDGRMHRLHRETGKESPNRKDIYTGRLGYGICNQFHGDIEYFYRIYPDRVEVFKVTGWDGKPETWKKIKMVKIKIEYPLHYNPKQHKNKK